MKFYCWPKVMLETLIHGVLYWRINVRLQDKNVPRNYFRNILPSCTRPFLAGSTILPAKLTPIFKFFILFASTILLIQFFYILLDCIAVIVKKNYESTKQENKVSQVQP